MPRQLRMREGDVGWISGMYFVVAHARKGELVLMVPDLLEGIALDTPEDCRLAAARLREAIDKKAEIDQNPD